MFINTFLWKLKTLSTFHKPSQHICEVAWGEVNMKISHPLKQIHRHPGRAADLVGVIGKENKVDAHFVIICSL